MMMLLALMGWFLPLLASLPDSNKVVSTRLQEPGGPVYEGGKAVAKVAGEQLFAPARESITYDISTRRASDAFLNYDWDGADQPLRLEQRHGPTSTEHVYDGSQRRVAKKVYENGSLIRTHRYVYQGWLPIVEEVTDRWGNPEYRNSYVWGPGPNGVRNPGIGATGQLALIIHQPQYGDPELSAPVYNHRLDVVGLVDVETGNVVAEYDYTPFGKTRRATGARAEQCPFRFAGAYLDEETRTYYFGYRHYDPRTKQWLTRDPIGEAGGLNLFAYANNDPINGIDVLGLDVASSQRMPGSVNSRVFWHTEGDVNLKIPIGTRLGRVVPAGRASSKVLTSDWVLLDEEYGGGVVYFKALEDAIVASPNTGGVESGLRYKWMNRNIDMQRPISPYSERSTASVFWGEYGYQAAWALQSAFYHMDYIDRAILEFTGWHPEELMVNASMTTGHWVMGIDDLFASGWFVRRKSFSLLNDLLTGVRKWTRVIPDARTRRALGSWKDFQKATTGQFKSLAEAETAWKVYQESSQAKKTLVIGRLPDTEAAELLGFQRLNLPSGWSAKVNDAWIQGGIDSGLPFKLVSPVNRSMLINPPGSLFPDTIFRRELNQLKEAGYRIKDGWAIPPGSR